MAISAQRFLFSIKISRFPISTLLSSSPNSTFSTSISTYPNPNPNLDNSHPNPISDISESNSNSFPNLNELQCDSLSTLTESHILHELSDLLPIRRTIVPKLYSPVSVPPPAEDETLANFNASPDGFLPLEDKLRGVFIQKLKGKASIENALSFALGGSELGIDVVSGVLDKGNLGGEAMVMFFDWVVMKPGVDRNVRLYNVILKALGRKKFLEFMMRKFREMAQMGVYPDCDTIMIVFDSLIRARRVSMPVEVFEELKMFGMDCDAQTFNVLLRCLCKRSYVGTANSLVRSMKGKVVFDCDSYNVVISGWARLGRVNEMKKCLNEMVDDGFTADCQTYSSVIEGLGRAGQINDAVKVFESMEDEGCFPDVRVYNALIANFVSVGDFSKCMMYYEEILRKNCEPDLDTYRSIIIGLIKARKVADALEMFDKMLDKRVIPTKGVVTSFIEPLCRFGPPHAAMMLYKSARKHGCVISLTGYKLLMRRLSRFGKCASLLKLWNEMQESGHSSEMDVYEYVVNGLCNNGQLDTAVSVMEEALRKGFCPNRLIYSKLNNKLLASDKAGIAYKLFLKVKQARIRENARKYWRNNGWHF